MPIKKQYPLFERVSPKQMFLKRLPLLSRKFTILNTKYFFKSLRNIVKHKDDPTYMLAKGYARRMFFRIINRRYDVAFDKMVNKFLKKTKGTEILILGHSHKAKEQNMKNKTLINTGTWRDEYVMSKYNELLKSKGKFFAEVIFTGNKLIGARLIKYKSVNKHVDIKIFDHFM